MNTVAHPAHRRVGRAIAAAMLAAPLLGGCVAAALPALALGGLATTRGGGEKAASVRPQVVLPAGQSTPVPAAPAMASPAGRTGALAPTPAATVREVAYADGSTVTVVNSLPASRDAAVPATSSGARSTGLTDLPSPGASALAKASIVPGETVRLTDLTALPAPSGALARTSQEDGHAAFAAFAAREAAIPVVGGERRSALLADSASMEPETRGCSIHPAAVLIDVDPAGGAIDLSRPLAGDPELAVHLAALRAQDVTIGWTTGRTADQAGAIRKALVASGLDPAGRDELVLLRFPEERKQTRRDEFAKSHCVVAIAGDERADFDELFVYLRDPATALPLDTMIGAGWFIVPPPLTPNQGPTD